MMRSGGLCAAIAFIGSALGFAGATTPAFSACQIQEFAEIQVSPGLGAPLVASQINGRQALLVADTAANFTLLWRQATEELSLKPKNLLGVNAYSGKGQITVERLTVNSFQLGNYTLKNYDFYILNENAERPNTSGLIGEDILAIDDIEFDLPENTIRLVKPVGCKGPEVVFWNKAYSAVNMEGFDDDARIFRIKVTINGKPVEAYINTGSDVSVLPFELAAKLGINTMPILHNDPTKGDYSKSVVKIESFGIGDEVIKNTAIQISKPRNRIVPQETGTRLGPEYLPPDLLLGADFFRSHIVLLAKSQNMMYFSYMGGRVFNLTGSAKLGAAPADATTAPRASASP